MELLNWFFLGLFIGGIGASLIVGYVELPSNELNNVLTNNNISVNQKATAFMAMEVSMKALAPAKRIDWLPGGAYGTKYYPILEDMPLPDDVDIIGILVMLIPMFLLFRWETEGADTILKFFLIILMIPLGVVIAKIFYFWLYYYSGHILGLSEASLTMIRESQLGVYDNVFLGMFLVAITSLSALAMKAVRMVTE